MRLLPMSPGKTLEGLAICSDLWGHKSPKGVTKTEESTPSVPRDRCPPQRGPNQASTAASEVGAGRSPLKVSSTSPLSMGTASYQPRKIPFPAWASKLPPHPLSSILSIVSHPLSPVPCLPLHGLSFSIAN